MRAWTQKRGFQFLPLPKKDTEYHSLTSFGVMMKEYRLNEYAVSRLPLMVWRQQGARNLHELVHRHDCIEIMYVSKGAGVCQINGKPYPATRGDLFVMSHYDTHEFVVERDFIYYTIMLFPDLFSAEELDGLRRFPDFAAWIAGDQEAEKKYCFMPPYSDELEEKINAVADEFRYRSEGFEINARANFISFLVSTLRSLNYIRLSQGTSGHESAVARVIHYINRHYHDALTLQILAKEARVAPSTLSKIFKRNTGDAIFDYIGKIRIGRAQFELEHTEKSISQIASDLGYYDSSYFSNAFRRHTGTSPRAYRANCLKIKND